MLMLTMIICLAVNCTDEPPERPETGTWEWNQNIGFETSITYTCGPYGNFEDPGGNKYNLIDSVCAWNKSWTPSQLDPCVAASCQVIPFPPEDTGMIFQPDPANPITLVSDYTVYNPKLPMEMAFPGDFCGDNGNIMMIVGIVPKVTRAESSLRFGVFHYYSISITIWMIKSLKIVTYVLMALDLLLYVLVLHHVMQFLN